jgi:hypothetical protein
MFVCRSISGLVEVANKQRQPRTQNAIILHVRNALQGIQYATYTSLDRTQVDTIQSFVVRIDNMLRELFSILGETPQGK